MNIFGTKQKLQVLLDATANATELPITAGYEEHAGGPGKPFLRTAQGISTGVTPVDIVPAAGEGRSRKITNMAIYNADNATRIITVRLSDSSSGTAVTRIIFKATLLTLESVYFTRERGWFCVDANGLEKTSASGNSTTTSTADSKGVSAGLATSVAVSQLLSIDAVDDTATSTADSKGVSAGLQGSVVLSTSTSADVRDSTQASVADSKGVSAGLAASVADSKGVSTGLQGSVVLSSSTSNDLQQSTSISTINSKITSGNI